jgi:predicted MFS family arabinose efflux permease
MVYRGGPALGAFAMGSAAEFIGFQSALACGGVIGAGALVWVFRQRKTMVQALETAPDDR